MKNGRKALLRRKLLVGIVAGTILHMTLLTCGCATRQSVVDIDAEHPELRLTESGIYMGEARVPPEKVVKTLEDADVPKDRTIHIGMERDLKDMRAPQILRAILAKGGYTRSILVTKRHAESVNLGKKKRVTTVSSSSLPKKEAKRVIRYKRANE